jgi:hypothetical protein
MSCRWTTYGPDLATETYVRPRFPVCKEGGRTYVWKGGKIYPHDFTMSHFLIALFVAIDTMLVVSSNPAGNFRESAR